MKLLDEIFTLDNLLHSLVAAVFVGVVSGLLAIWTGQSSWAVPFSAAFAATIGLYLREASQVDWDFTLHGSLHKHLEWIVGSSVGWTTAGFLAILGAVL